MKTKILLLSVAMLSFLVTGCSTVSSGIQYKASIPNVIEIQRVFGSAQVKVSDFTTAPTVEKEQWCRAVGPVSLAGGQSTTQYIQHAFMEELFLAKVYSNSATNIISGRIDDLHFSSMSPAYWQITITLSSSTGASYQISNQYNFDTSFAAIHACQNVTDAFGAAVQETLRKAVFDPRFKTLVSNR